MKTYLQNDLYNRLRKKLAELFLTDQQAITIARQASLNITLIDFKGGSFAIMDAVLSRAEDEQKVLPLIEASIRERGGNSDLEKLKNEIFEGGTYKVEAVTGDKDGEKIKILIIYDGADKDYVTEFIKHLHVLAINGDVELIDLFATIQHGNISKQEKEFIKSSEVVLPIISPNFFNPDTNHLANTRLAFESNRIVVPILMRPCLYGRVQALKDIRTYPVDTFISNYDKKDAILNEIANSIGSITDKILNK